MAFSNRYIVGFAFGVCVACSLLVSGAAVSLRERQALNRERDLHRSILEALQFDTSALAGPEIDQLWTERVELAVFTADGTPVPVEACPRDLTGDGRCDLADTVVARERVKGTSNVPELLALYRRVDDGQTAAWAMPVYGKGLWGPIAGYIALGPSVEEVVGATFFGPKETPGLGAEIEQEPFRAQWVGKRIFEGAQPRGVRVAKGSAAQLYPNEVAYWVDGVSGATITSRGVSEMVVQGVERDYAATLRRLREGGGQ